MSTEAQQPPTPQELNRALSEEIQQFLDEHREEIIRRVHAKLRAEGSSEVKPDEQAT